MPKTVDDGISMKLISIDVKNGIENYDLYGFKHIKPIRTDVYQNGKWERTS